MNEIHKTNSGTLTEIEQLREENERMQIMLGVGAIIKIMFDSNFEVLDCNVAAVEFMGFESKEELFAGCIERIAQIVPPFQSNGKPSVPVTERLETAVKEGTVEFETEVVLDGTVRHLDVEFRKVPYKNSFVVVACALDVTDRRKQESELRRLSEQNELQFAKLKMAAKATKIGLWDMEIINDDLRNPADAFNWSDEFRKLLGFSDETDFPNLLGSWSDRLHPEDKEKTLDHAVKHILDKTGNTPYEAEYRLLKKNGEYGYFRAYGGTFRDEQGNAFRIAGTLMDITETKNVLLKNELQLTKLNLAVQATKIGLWDRKIVDGDLDHPDNSFTFSSEFRQLLGFSNEEDFPNTLQSWSNRLHPEDKERVLDCFRKHLLDKTGDTLYDVEYRLLKKNGEYAYFHAAGKTIRDSGGNAVHVAGSLIDVTETKNILLETERQKIAAEAANKAKTEFLSVMSHEIRTPMNAILGIAEIQLLDETLPHSVSKALERIHSAGNLLLRIINDILDLSKIEADKLELVSAKYEIASLINDVATLNVMRTGSKQIEFTLSVNENTPSVLCGDELRIKQVLNNLLSNAFKYTEEGNVRLSVSSETKESEATLVFEVSDTGRGMTKEQVEKLFDRYTRFHTNTNRTIEGTGLGMSITQKLVDLMGGKISVKSEAGKGTVVTVSLPQENASPNVLGKELAESLQRFRIDGLAQIQRAQIVFEPMPYGTVLVVDDVESNLYVATGLLAPYSLSVDTAESGFAAIEKVKAGKVYDVIFMDHMMPKMDGIEAAKIIRSMRYEHPIVALTANAVIGQAEMFIENGFDGFVSKPIDMRQLNLVLKRFIRDKQPPEVLEAVHRQNNKKHAADETVLSSLNPHVIKFFVQDAHKAVAALKAICESGSAYSSDDVRTYTINVHNMKSVLAYIGKSELSAFAAKLEHAGRENDIAFIAAETPLFLEGLEAVIEQFTPQEDEDGGIEVGNHAYLREKLLSLLPSIKAACEVFDKKTAKDALAELRQEALPRALKLQLETMSEQLLNGDFEEVSRLAESCLMRLTSMEPQS